MGSIDDYKKKESKFNKFANKYFDAKYSIIWIFLREMIKKPPTVIGTIQGALIVYCAIVLVMEGGWILLGLLMAYGVAFVVKKWRYLWKLKQDKKKHENEIINKLNTENNE